MVPGMLSWGTNHYLPLFYELSFAHTCLGPADAAQPNAFWFVLLCVWRFFNQRYHLLFFYHLPLVPGNFGKKTLHTYVGLARTVYIHRI